MLFLISIKSSWLVRLALRKAVKCVTNHTAIQAMLAGITDEITQAVDETESFEVERSVAQDAVASLGLEGGKQAVDLRVLTGGDRLQAGLTVDMGHCPDGIGFDLLEVEHVRAFTVMVE